MTHFGIICPPATGHLNPTIALGQELQKRGHHITLISLQDAQAKVLKAGFSFQAIGAAEFPKGASQQLLEGLGKLGGLAASRYGNQLMKQQVAVLLRDGPEIIRQAGIEVLLIDQISKGGTIVAQLLHLPFVILCNSLLSNADDTIPPFLTSWSYSPAWWARWRNRMGYALLSLVNTSEVKKVIAEYRQKWKLPADSSSYQRDYKLAYITQQLVEFEFPHIALPNCFHFAGPFRRYLSSGDSISFPYEKLTGQPLIYASMGTVLNRQRSVFQKIISACTGLNAQLVLSLGLDSKSEISLDYGLNLESLPSNIIVVNYAPQLELLQKSALAIIHAGLNSVLESLSNGVPIVAIPISFDQPGVAARLAWSGAGEFIPIRSLTTRKLRTAIERVLGEDSYKKNAVRLQEAIQRTGGASRAADIIEQGLKTGKPVLA